MRILGVPAGQFALCLLITTALTFIFFLPAISGFGHVLLGKEDMMFFMWLFWHYGQSVAHGTDPFYASEIGYPYGMSLSESTVTPFQGALYLLMPGDWGVFGRITVLQLLSFVLGGLFSFALAYRFCRSFMPSLIGSFIFNFSGFHFEKALHHLNYSMVMPFAALFFLCYYDALDQKAINRRHLWLALALLLVALNEAAVAVMIGFVIFIDIFLRYAKASDVNLLSMRSMLILGGASVLCLLLFEISSAAHFPAAFIYVVPGALFVAICVFIVLRKDNLLRNEAADAFFVSMAVCAIPTLGYLALLAIHGYAFEADSVLANAEAFQTPVQFLLIPSTVQQASHLGLFQGLQIASETGVYLGPAVILLLLVSMFLPGASDDENRARDLGILCLLFSFPVITVGSRTVLGTPFFAGTLFPLLGVLRVSSRFMLFVSLFISVAAALLCVRLFAGRKNGTLMAGALAAILLATSWPALGSFAFDQHIPQFYLDLAKTPGNSSIFIYPDLEYGALEEESYYQTFHGDNLSYGTVSRFPEGTNPLFALYREENVTPQDVVPVVRSLGYDYLVVEKLRCPDIYACFNGDFVPVPAGRIGYIRSGMEDAFGNATYEDDAIIVYDAKAHG